MWGVLFFLAFISEANANIKKIDADAKEEQTKAGIVIHLDEVKEERVKGSIEEKMTGSGEEKCNEIPSQVLPSLSGEVEKPSSPFLGRNETSSSPGIQISLGEKYLEKKVSFPITDAPWWERWWFSIKEWWAQEVTQ